MELASDSAGWRDEEGSGTRAPSRSAPLACDVPSALLTAGRLPAQRKTLETQLSTQPHTRGAMSPWLLENPTGDGSSSSLGDHVPFLTFLAWEKGSSLQSTFHWRDSKPAGSVSHLQDYFPSSAAEIKCFVPERGVLFPTLHCWGERQSVVRPAFHMPTHPSPRPPGSGSLSISN